MKYAIVSSKEPIYGIGIVEIPDDVTDWEFFEYDGGESVIYVLDGKIHHGHVRFSGPIYQTIIDGLDRLGILKKHKEETK